MLDTTKNQIVGVEFDSFENQWDPSADHVGINVNSIKSVSNVTWKSSIKDGRAADAWMKSDSTTKNPSVFLTYANQLVLLTILDVTDLRQVLPERVRIGFSAATSDWIEIHNILAWPFSSSLEDNGKKNMVGLGVGVSVAFCSVTFAAGILWFTLRRKRRRKK